MLMPHMLSSSVEAFISELPISQGVHTLPKQFCYWNTQSQTPEKCQTFLLSVSKKMSLHNKGVRIIEVGNSFSHLKLDVVKYASSVTKMFNECTTTTTY